MPQSNKVAHDNYNLHLEWLQAIIRISIILYINNEKAKQVPYETSVGYFVLHV